MWRASAQAKVQASESRALGSPGNSLKTRSTNDALVQGGLDTNGELPVSYFESSCQKHRICPDLDKISVH